MELFYMKGLAFFKFGFVSLYDELIEKSEKKLQELKDKLNNF